MNRAIELTRWSGWMGQAISLTIGKWEVSIGTVFWSFDFLSEVGYTTLTLGWLHVGFPSR